MSPLPPQCVRWVEMAVITCVIKSDENGIESLFPLSDIQEEKFKKEINRHKIESSICKKTIRDTF